jgi:hypothetical protein
MREHQIELTELKSVFIIGRCISNANSRRPYVKPLQDFLGCVDIRGLAEMPLG